MSNRFGGSTVGTNYRGNKAVQPPDWSFEARDPNQYDSFNHEVGDLWMNTVTELPWILVSLAGTTSSKGQLAHWIQFASATGLLTSLTSNTGGTVYGDVNQNINTVGDGTTITGVGNPGTHTITFSVVGGRAAQSFVATSPVATPTVTGGTATPLLGVINVQASHNLSVSAGTPNTGAANDIVYWTNNVSVWGDLANVTAGNASVESRTGDITITASNGVGNLNIPTTTSTGNAGVVTQGGTGFLNRLLHTYGFGNIFLGSGSGNLTLTTGSATTNVGVGENTLLALTTGANNIAIGHNALTATTLGQTNIAIGSNALVDNTQGVENIAIGGSTLADNINGFQNIAIGTAALAFLTTGFLNTCVGHNAGNGYGTSESNNIIIGDSGGVTGESNTIRISSLVGTANSNIFIGQNNPGAAITVASAVNNVCVGRSSLLQLTTGVANTHIGTVAGSAITTGSSNTSIGNNSLSALTTGQFNVALGQGSGTSYTTSESSNIVIGNIGAVGESNTIRVGGATGTGAGQQNRFFAYGVRGITTGVNDAIAVLIDSAGQLGTVSSSMRYKDNIHDMFDYSSDIYNLRPVVFNFKGQDKISYGLIAEEVEDVIPNLVVYNDDKEPETVKYLDLIPMLLNEIQKLSKRVDFLENGGKNDK